jgi:hypothetical protein
MDKDDKPPVLPPNPLGPIGPPKPQEQKLPLPYTHGIMGAQLGDQPQRQDVFAPGWSTPWGALMLALGSGLLVYWLSYGAALAFGTLEATHSPAKTLAPLFQKTAAAFDWMPPYWEALALGPIYGFVVNAANAHWLIVIFGFFEAVLFIASVMVSAQSRVTLGLVTAIVVLLNLLVLAKYT